jgi:hypothetical protein
VRIERTSKPVFMFCREAASGPLMVKKRGGAVGDDLPTLPVPSDSLCAKSFSEDSLSYFSLAGSFDLRGGE